MTKIMLRHESTGTWCTVYLNFVKKVVSHACSVVHTLKLLPGVEEHHLGHAAYHLEIRSHEIHGDHHYCEK